MYVIDGKGKRYWSVTGPVSSDITAQKFWPTTCQNIFTILKTRPDITGLKEKYMPSNRMGYYFETKTIHTLVVTPDDLLELYSLNKQRGYDDTFWFTQDDILELYNQKHNTQFRYVSYGKEYNQVCRDLRFNNVNIKFAIADLPDDWKVMFEVYTYQDFTRINSYTSKELERLEADKKAKANKDIFNTFLKSQVEEILKEFGLYYNDFYETFRFKTVKDFRLFLQKAINDIIGAKLKAKGINCKGAIRLKGVRSCKIDCEILDIINASDITLTEEETNNE